MVLHSVGQQHFPGERIANGDRIDAGEPPELLSLVVFGFQRPFENEGLGRKALAVMPSRYPRGTEG
jgi:hypothetical protein